MTITMARFALVVLLVGARTDFMPWKVADLSSIQHVVVIMQENRSYDTYFGTFPGGDGWLYAAPGYCNPDWITPGKCDAPFHDPNMSVLGGPHTATAFAADYANGSMNGFVASAQQAGAGRGLSAIGYKDATELPVYWSYAQQGTLQDHLFAPSISWSQPAHLYMVSGWSASCSDLTNPMSCATSLGNNSDSDKSVQPGYIWTDITYLLHNHNPPVSWGYYVAPGTQPDCDDGSVTCCPVTYQTPATPEIWNPLPDFQTVHQDGELGNIQATANFIAAARSGTLPAVSWVVPNQNESEHPPARVDVGQQYVSQLVNAVMQGPDWSSTAIFLSWDEWGGFFDHVPPATLGSISGDPGLGFRVPGIVISPWVKHGFIDSQTLSHDNYLKFIEDRFLLGKRIDPASDGRPDSRPDVRETSSILGDLSADFDFTQTPMPVVTGVVPPTASTAGGTNVLISGADFTGATAVTFGSNPATSFTVNSNSQITAVSPPGSGSIDVTVTAAASSTVVPVDHFTYTAGPAVSSIFPSSGPPGGSTSVTISGSGFSGATNVHFGATPAGTFQVVSDSQITATAPPGGPTVDVTVTSPAGTSVNNAADVYTYVSSAAPVVSSVAPNSGSAAGCNAVTIVGSGFSNATQVVFGSKLAGSFVVNSDTNIVAVAPPQSGGAVDVQVTAPLGTSPVGSQDRYSYLPQITGLSPKSGPAAGGTSVVITGIGFAGTTLVYFGSVAATFTINSATRITAISPAGGGTVQVTVANSTGVSPTSRAGLFSYQ